jgi:uncharacterized protein (TIGR02596 family)
MKNNSPSKFRAAFSLVELLVVITIIGIIAGFAVPAVTGVIRGSALTQASQMITEQFSLARQLALSKNRAMEVRLYQFADPEVPDEVIATPATWQYRGFQVFEIVESGAATPLDKPQRFPDSVVMSARDTFSTLISGSGRTAQTPGNKDPDLPRGVGKNYRYVSFRFLQDGSTNLPATGTTGWFVTLHTVRDRPSGTVPPANFFTLQLDPVSGSSRAFRPTAG